MVENVVSSSSTRRPAEGARWFTNTGGSVRCVTRLRTACSGRTLLRPRGGEMEKDGTSSEDRPARPTPIRDAVGGGRASEKRRGGRAPKDRRDSGPAEQRASSPGLRGQKARPEGPRGARGPGTKGKRTRPVPARAATAGSVREPTPMADLPAQTFEAEGSSWIARLTGRTVSGAGAVSGAPLLELTFCRADAPTQPVRRTLTVGRSLEEVDAATLPGLLASARELADVPPKAEPLPDKG